MPQAVVSNHFTDCRDPGKHVPRTPGELIELDEGRVQVWEERGLVKVLREPPPASLEPYYPWNAWDGRDLRVLPRHQGAWKRVVACVNIWNDLPDLLTTWKTWYPFVDHVIVVDGAYAGTPADKPYSTDGLQDFLQPFHNVELVETGTFWPSQHAKRSEYFRRGQEGDLMFRVDADEFVTGADKLCYLPDFDVGWATVLSPLYGRPQRMPMLYKWRPGLHYRYRHHWVYDDDSLVATGQNGGDGYEHAIVPIILDNKKGVARSTVRVQQAQTQRSCFQAKQEKEESPDTRQHGNEALRILQLTPIDPGRAVYRFHAALNTTTPHDSILASMGAHEVMQEPQHLHVQEDRDIVRLAVQKADVIHCHLHYHELLQLGVHPQAPVVIHHHGSMFRKAPEKAAKNDKIFKPILKLVSNFELMQYGDGLTWFPNPIPVSRYAALARESRPAERKPFRIAHSPTKRHYKGTPAFLAAVASLQQKGLEIEPVLIEQMSHAQALALKATCHATFDSFWLGLQVSGLEGAAMGHPVVAGDARVREGYQEHFGEVPYTFADTQEELENVLGQLVMDFEFFTQERDRVGRYVRAVHDYGAVSKFYLDLLDEKLDWRNVLEVRADPDAKTYQERKNDLDNLALRREHRTVNVSV